MKLRNTKVKIWVCTHYLHKLLTLFFFPAEDEAAAARISAKNGLESYAYNLRNSLNDEKLADKFEAADKTKLEGAVSETIKWLDVSQEGSKEEYEDKQKELESIARYVCFLAFLFCFLIHIPFPSPIMQKLYSAAGGVPGGASGASSATGGAPGGFPGASQDGPSVEEVD